MLAMLYIKQAAPFLELPVCLEHCEDKDGGWTNILGLRRMVIKYLTLTWIKQIPLHPCLYRFEQHIKTPAQNALHIVAGKKYRKSRQMSGSECLCIHFRSCAAKYQIEVVASFYPKSALRRRENQKRRYKMSIDLLSLCGMEASIEWMTDCNTVRQYIQERLPLPLEEVLKLGSARPEALAQIINTFLPVSYGLQVEICAGPIGRRSYQILTPEMGVKEMAAEIRHQRGE